MSATDIAARIISQFEGLGIDDPAHAIANPDEPLVKPYLDPVGIPTIGYGLITLDGNRVTMATPPISYNKALSALSAEIVGRDEAIRKLLTVSVTDNEEAALISFVYNSGIAALRMSTLLRLLNAGDRAGAANQFGAWCHAGGKVLPGLVRRRAYERSVFLGETVC